MTVVWIALGGMLALVLGIASVSRPARVLLPVYAAAVPAGSVVEISVPLPAPFNTLSSLVGGMLLVTGVLHILLHRRGRVPTIPVALWLVFLAWATLSVFWAIDLPGAKDAILVAWPLVVLLLVVGLLPTDEADLDAFRLGAIAGAILVGIYALVLLVTGNRLEAQGNMRFVIGGAGGETDPNILAASLLLPLALSLERVIVGGRRWLGSAGWRWLGAAGVVLSIVAIVLTGSRGGLLSMALVFVLTLLYGRRVSGGKVVVRRIVVGMLVGGFAIYGAAAISLAVSPQGTVRRILDGSALSRIPATELGGSGRLEIWATGIEACKTYCAAGSGLGTFETAFEEKFAFAGTGRNVGQARPAHSIYLSLAVETGLIGLSLLLLAAAAEWRVLSRAQHALAAPGLLPAYAALLVANGFLGTVWFKYFWLTLIMARLAEAAAPAEAPITAPASLGGAPRAALLGPSR